MKNKSLLKAAVAALALSFLVTPISALRAAPAGMDSAQEVLRRRRKDRREKRQDKREKRHDKGGKDKGKKKDKSGD